VLNNSTTYTSYVNFKIKELFGNFNNSIIFGQNIIAGSRISGLGAELENVKDCTAINTTNSENSLIGMGFGLSLCSIPSMLILKQHDFALLGIDQITNTFNLIRNGKMQASFSILMVVVDSGFEGPQSSLNNLNEFASIARTPVLFLSTKGSIDYAFEQTREPGLHLLAISQSDMKRSLLLNKNTKILEQAEYFQATNLKKITPKVAVVFFGMNVNPIFGLFEKYFSFEHEFDLFVMLGIFEEMSDDTAQILGNYKKVIIVDSSKSIFRSSSELALLLEKNRIHLSRYNRVDNATWSEVFSDIPEYSIVEIESDIIGEI
jgi:pyruvate dehydrogenase E1 component beta subunit